MVALIDRIAAIRDNGLKGRQAVFLALVDKAGLMRMPAPVRFAMAIGKWRWKHKFPNSTEQDYLCAFYLKILLNKRTSKAVDMFTDMIDHLPYFDDDELWDLALILDVLED